MNFGLRLDEILGQAFYIKDGEYIGSYQEDNPIGFDIKQAITSLIKELVAEAKPKRQPPMKMGNPTKESSDLDKMIFAKKKGHNEAIDKFEQNLLKALEEV